MTPLPSDARLAHRATDGDRRAFAAIYRRYHQDLYRFCLSILGRPEDAQEALQNTMVKALRSLPGEEREIQLKPWLYRVAHNESIDLLRRRREGVELDAAQVSGAAEIAETVALRERLGRLLADLGELPERQRSALVMRELVGLGYEQIGEAFDSSASVARQTVYEARLNLRELETGREMSCDQVTKQLSEADGRVTRRRDIQAHLRNCAECRGFRDSIDIRRQDLAALSPLPAALVASILHGLAGGQAATGIGSSAAAAGAGAGAGKVAATSVVLKAVATVAVVATVGVTAADRGGLIDAGLPGGSGDNANGVEEQSQGAGAGMAPPLLQSASSPSQRADAGGGRSDPGRANGIAPSQGIGNNGGGGAVPETSSQHAAPAGGHHGASNGLPAALPEASRHGQETAAAHKASGSESSGRGHHKTSQGHSHASTKKTHPSRSSSGSHRRGPPSQSGPPEHAQKGGASGGKDQSSKLPPASPKHKGSQPTRPEAQSAGGATGESGPGNSSKLKASP
ncbi:MAG: hypothetical protein QOF85_838 [Solirubrobacterales bacterium]|jgi:RNA polymerase sigma factor (sigma-70 family)|nr:hypothetical protein [Solirubrobacterales bacterium]